MNPKLVIALMGLPARGKSTMAAKIAHTMKSEGVKVEIFNNGELRRRLSKENTSYPEFFSPDNREGVELRERYARINMEQARSFLESGGELALIDATNVTRHRRRLIEDTFRDVPLLFLECMNADEEALEANLERKTSLQELSHLTAREALDNFRTRIAYYESIYEPLKEERNRVLVDSFEGCILQEELTDLLPYWDRLKDLITTRVVHSLFLVRHGQTHYNLEDRIGGDSDLTDRGWAQARALADHFSGHRIPIIFTSNYKRTRQTAIPIARRQEHCSIIALTEFNEIHAGVCEGMTYQEIREKMPEVAGARRRDKYGYVYPEGEGYATMESRIYRGIQKVFYLSNHGDDIMIVGHQAVNRMILSYFLFRPKEEVPFIYMPQDRYYNIQITPHKKLFELKPFHSEQGRP